jgi:uncharacterized membrane protein YbhN (UPF0104 family)
MTPKRAAGLILRVAVTVGAIALAFRKVPASDVLPLLARLHPLPLVSAVLLLHAAQTLSALRTRYYLREQGIAMPVKPSLQLHYVGGLFNALLPGGTGGDAYKAWWLKKYHSGSLLSLVGLMVAGRLNGLWALGVIACALALMSPSVHALTPYAPAIAVGIAVGGTLAYHLMAGLVLREPLSRQYRAGMYSFALQVMSALCAWQLATALGLDHALEYVALFMLSCVLAMLPISIGGIGVRELALLHGSQYLGLAVPDGVALALSFSLINLTIPLIGAMVYGLWRPHAKESLA